jgi:hypothetical protein
MNNEQINDALCKINKAVSNRVTQSEYKDDSEEKLLFYVSQALFLAVNFSQDLVDKEKEGGKMTLESIKAAIANGSPVLTTIGDNAAVIVGYDDEKQRFCVRICGGEKTWVPYFKVSEVDSAPRILTEEEKKGKMTDKSYWELPLGTFYTDWFLIAVIVIAIIVMVSRVI